MVKSSRPNIRIPVLVLVATLLAACAEEDEAPARLFDENGTWSLQEFSPEGSGGGPTLNGTVRENAFMVRFSEDLGALAAAACSSSLTNPDFSPSSSQCRLGDASENPPEWDCQCYSYYWPGETSQTWLHYKPKSGSKPPDPHNDADNSSTTSLTEVAPNTYRFSPLPNPLFDSDGESSSFVFRHKADTLFDETGCWEHCFD
ncbi:MAG: hypothetical protein V3V08_21410 [Nannocystaceae bacterium]